MPLAGAGRPQHARLEARGPRARPDQPGGAEAERHRETRGSTKAEIAKQMANKVTGNAEALAFTFGFLCTEMKSLLSLRTARERARLNVIKFRSENVFA